MSTDGRPAEVAGAGLVAVVAVLAPILSGALAAVLLLVGYILKMLVPEPAIAQTVLTGGWVFGAVAAVTLLVAAAGLLLTALRKGTQAVEEGPETAPTGTAPGSRAGLRTVDFASFVAGDRRAHLREEWAAVLAGDPGNGIVLSSRRRMRYAIGFLRAALRMRLNDLAAPLWMPVDWLLSLESRTHGLIALAVGAQIVYIQHEDGLHALVTEGWGWCAGCGIALRLFLGWLRRIRGIELASARSNSADQ
ncbi:hypothetical protein ACFVT5_39735 [Streptomyces sp. NPDC058001]|uniref:hypothetical protein n=1 Tax=Streptomyces sp. NPDC058001 TaxID=3346300 RepID=UPI0036EA106B